MILNKPTVLINRMQVRKNGIAVMDIAFHAGLNIITGENSSGKTTAIRFLAFALGAENINFNQVAQLCDEIYLEISANEAVVTLRRHVSVITMRPLDIFWGSLDNGLVAAFSMWQQYPFRRSEEKESFSQILFRLLGMPELRGEGGSNITMHQLLRLIYSDQETPAADIFRIDPFDRAITRAAIGDYLLGVDSTELYELKLQEANAEKEASALRTSIKTIYNTFGHSGTNVSLEFIDEQVNTLASEVSELQKKLDDISLKPSKTTTSSNEDNSLRLQLTDSHTRLSKAREQKLELESELADSELFLKELEERLLSLEESAIAESHIGTAVFNFCPSCFSKLDTNELNTTHCSLCKSPVSDDSARSQLGRMRNELALQLKESESIRVQQLDELSKLDIQIPSLNTELKRLEAEYKRNQSNWRSPEHILIQQLSKEIGGKEQEIKNAFELKKLADLLEKLNTQLGAAEARSEYIKGRIDAVKRYQDSLRQKAYLAVVEKLRAILSQDLARQEEFAQATKIDIDFAANKLIIDGQAQFSASSMVFLRHAFHLAVLIASLENTYFRYPRLLILDGVEDGGMEVDRSYNFQRIIRNQSEQSNVVHQIIMTTMNVWPELDTEEYVVGPKFTHEKRSIELH
jgi:hypothetical protein